MFSSTTYAHRRAQLMQALDTGLVWLPGNDESPMNYAGNPYPFRQDSSFLYYFGHDQPGLQGLLDLDAGEAWLFGTDPELHDRVWTGPQATVSQLAEQVGATGAADPADLAKRLTQALEAGRPVHFLPPYRAATALAMGQRLGLPPDQVAARSSQALVAAVVAQRAVKSPEEIAEMDRAVKVCGVMHRAAIQATRPGIREARLAGIMEGIAIGEGGRLAYPAIVTIQGQVLHNPHHFNTLAAGRLLLADCGAETPRRYAGDITRTWPVDPRFSDRQREVYEIVLAAQLAALDALAPGRPYLDIHRLACRVLTEGLQGIGLMRGNLDESVAAGAHALFFPHGLGHLIGLDVHDMENLGEDHVGYDAATRRSEQFGTRALRLGRALQPGFTLSVEPGLYFIPELIDQWREAGRHDAFIRYDRLQPYRDFGGVRIEDLALITADGHRLLGEPIPKTVDEIEGLRGV